MNKPFFSLLSFVSIIQRSAGTKPKRAEQTFSLPYAMISLDHKLIINFYDYCSYTTVCHIPLSWGTVIDSDFYYSLNISFLYDTFPCLLYFIDIYKHTHV